MSKKVLPNKKYSNVEKVLDTGNTIKDVQILSDKYVSKRKGELFRRIKPGTVVKLVEENNNTESIYNIVDEDHKDENISVITGMTAKTGRTEGTTITAITYNTEMLGNLVMSINFSQTSILFYST